MSKASKIISVLFHPLLMPTLGFLILFNSGTYLGYIPFDFKKMIFLIVVLCTLVIPLSLIPFFLYQKMIFSIHMSEKRERLVPLVITFLLYFFCYYLLARIPIPPLYQAFCLSAVISVLIALIITIKWKISIHMTGIGGIIGLIVFLIYSMRINLEFYLIISLLCAGLIGTARLQLKAHNPPELYTGFITGLIVIPSVMLLF